MDTPHQNDADTWKPRATLRRGTASLTASAARARLHRHGGAVGEGAR
ncbi:DUF6380 family protein [Streptomyces sp. NPDC020707]